jgi:hypothetical protein
MQDVYMLLCPQNLVKGEIYILVWGYMHELICIVTYTTLKCFIVIDDRSMIPQVKYCGCGLLLYMNIPSRVFMQECLHIRV